MKYYFVKSFNLPFEREWNIFNNWFSSDKQILIENVRKDLEENVLLEPTTFTEEDGWLLVNGETEKWLLICEIKMIDKTTK